MSAGPHGDGRFEAVGDLIRHIISAETRYVERLADRPLTDRSSVPVEDLDRLIDFGHESRRKLRHFIDSYPADQWDVLQELSMTNSRLTATPRKILLHVVTHEIRHWAQVATLLRLQGVPAICTISCSARSWGVRSRAAPAHESRQVTRPRTRPALPVGDASSTQPGLYLVTNWFEELRRRAAN